MGDGDIMALVTSHLSSFYTTSPHIHCVPGVQVQLQPSSSPASAQLLPVYIACQVFKSSFNRPNLRYEVVKKKKVSRSYMYGSVPHLVIGCGLPSDPPHDFE